jgi:DIRP
MPRRLSAAFLTAERAELETYRHDARAILRNQPLDSAVEARSGAPLGRLWWQRYLFDLSTMPQRGVANFLRMRAIPPAPTDDPRADGPSHDREHHYQLGALPPLRAMAMPQPAPSVSSRSRCKRGRVACRHVLNVDPVDALGRSGYKRPRVTTSRHGSPFVPASFCLSPNDN